MFKRGTLWSEIVRATENAISSGALQPIPTEYTFIQDGGVRFFVRVLSSLARKDEARKEQESRSAAGGEHVNPFLPYEEDLYVADISDSHVALLNKFNVVEHHLLIVTREYEDQNMLLTKKDFDALWTCMKEYDSLGFYNGGETAGASQRHKHLQVVPLPLAPEGPNVPIEPLLADAEFDGELGMVRKFTFRHEFVRLREAYDDIAQKTFDLYSRMLDRLEMAVPSMQGPVLQSGPYCLLVTREWMLLVPRSTEFFDGVSINSLGYAGALLVRSEEQMNRLEEYGPIRVLQSVSLPPDINM